MADDTPKSPRLHTLDPDAFVLECCELVASHLQRFAVVKLDPAWQPHELPDGEALAAGSNLAWSLRDLASFAQRGGNAEEGWGTAQSVCEALYPRPIDRGTYHVPILECGQVEPETALDVVLLATHARHQLARDKSVTARALSALGGVSKQYLAKIGEGAKRSRTTGARGAAPLTPTAARTILARLAVGEETARELIATGAEWHYQCGGSNRWIALRSGTLAVSALASQRGWSLQSGWWYTRAEAPASG